MAKYSRWRELDVYVNDLNGVAYRLEQQASKLAMLGDPEFKASEGDHVETMAAPLRRLRAAAEKALAALGQLEEPSTSPPPSRGFVLLRGGLTAKEHLR